ncbi:MAG: L,D-transpeptidase [Verrucomicrobia bacterium]|nr:L,D-transpeptidase [Verrucomicrobiota bacterium]
MKRATQSVPKFPAGLQRTMTKLGVRRTHFLLCVSVADQAMNVFEKTSRRSRNGDFPVYEFRQWFVVSTSRFGIGQIIHSNRTPLGLHRIARKIGGDYPKGTIFKARKPIGRLSPKSPKGDIVHRILWLAGMEEGKNRGGKVDTFSRYIYIHGYWDESTLGRPQSLGCIHLAASDLIPLYDQVPLGTLVWIARR